MMKGLGFKAFLALILSVTLSCPILAQSDEAGALEQRVIGLFNASKFAETLPVAEQYVAAARSRLGEDHPRTATAMDWLARVHQANGRFDDAEPHYRKSLTIREKVLGPEHPDVATSLNNLAGLHQDQGRFDDVEPLVRRGLEIRRKVLGPEHPDVATSLNSLAGYYQNQARFGDAEPLFRQALEIRRKAFGLEHADVVTSLNDLAALYRDQDRLAEAEPLFKQALAAAEKVHGARHPEVAVVLNNLAGLYRDQGRFADAEQFYKRALDIRETVFGTGHPDVAVTLGSLALLYKTQGHGREAETHFKLMLDIREKSLGPNHPDLAYGLEGLADLYQDQDRLDEADPLISRALGIHEKVVGPDHPNVAASLGVLAGIRLKQGLTKDAERYYVRALAIQERALGATHLDTTATRGNLGSLFKSEGRLDEARPLLESALSVRKGALMADHPAIAVSLLQLSDLYRQQGRLEDARKLFQQAARMRKAGIREVPVFFATDRKPASGATPAFGNERANRNQLTFGEVKVAIPKVQGASSAAAKASTVAADGEQGTDVRRLSLHQFRIEDEKALLRAAQVQVQQARMFKSEALVFVHGYSVSFEDAVRRAGQIAYDLDFDGPMFLFSWPSRASFLGYLSDNDAVDFAAPHLKRFLQTIATMKPRKIHVIAHSMGNLVLVRALEKLAADSGAVPPPLAEIINANPDVDPDLYSEFVKRLKESKGTNITLYASGSDKALWVSSGLRSVARAGYISDGWEPTPGADAIDITGAGARLFSFNHDVYASDRLLAQDMRGILRGERPPEQRTTQFKRMNSAHGAYWKYQRPAAGVQ